MKHLQKNTLVLDCRIEKGPSNTQREHGTLPFLFFFSILSHSSFQTIQYKCWYQQKYPEDIQEPKTLRKITFRIRWKICVPTWEGESPLFLSSLTPDKGALGGRVWQRRIKNHQAFIWRTKKGGALRKPESSKEVTDRTELRKATTWVGCDS